MDNTTSDFLQQIITFNSTDGPVSVALPDIDDWILYSVQVCVNYGSQIGACIITLLALMLLTKPDKRFSAIMVLNCLSLIFGIISRVLGCIYFSGPFAEIYAHFTADYSLVTKSDTAMSVTATVVSLLMHITVEASLWLQVRVVCITLRDFYQYMVLAVSTILALLTTSFRFAYVVANDKLIVEQIPSLRLAWYGEMNTIFFAVSLVWFCSVFVGKLAFALHQRKKLGLGQFGPMQVLIIMGFQTCIIPVFFSIYQYWGPPALASYNLTACAIFLPLSSLWASASIANRSSANKSSRNTFSTAPAGLLGNYASHKASNGLSSPGTIDTTVRDSGNMSPKNSHPDHFMFDLEKQDLQ